MSSITTVNSVALHLVAPVKNPYAMNILSALITKEDIIATDMKNTLARVSRVPSAFEYAKEHYTLGLPQGANTSLKAPTNAQLVAATKTAINYEFNVIINLTKYYTYKPFFEILYFLDTDRSLNLKTEKCYKFGTLDFTLGQELRIISSTLTTNAANVVMVYEYWGWVHYPEIPGETTIPAYDKYEKLQDLTETVTRLSTTNTVFDDKILIIWFTKLDSLGVLIPGEAYWIYRISTKTYPALDNNSTTITTDEYFPVIPLRFNNVDLTGEDATTYTERIATLEQQLPVAQSDYDVAFAIDHGVGTGSGETYEPPPSEALYVIYQDLNTAYTNAQNSLAFANAVKETDLYKTSKQLLKLLDLPIDQLGQTINGSDNLADIDHAYVIFGADLQTTHNDTLVYLNYYFDYLRSSHASQYSVTGFSTNELAGTIPYDTSSLTEHGLNLKVEIGGITTTYVASSVKTGKVGQAQKTITYIDIPASGGGDSGQPQVDARTDTTVTLDLQWTPSLIRRVVVTNLVVTNYVSGDYSVVTTPKEVVTDEGNHNLIIPIEYNISLQVPLRQRMQMYNDCSLLVINAVQRIKLKWYQEKWFAIIVMVVAVVITVYSGQAWVMGIATLLDVVIIIALLIYIALIVAVNIALKWIISKIGGKLGMILAVVIAIIGLMFGRGEIAIEFTKEFALTYAQMALMACQAVLSTTVNFFNTETVKLVEMYTEFTVLLKAAYDAIDTNTEVMAMDMRAEFNPLDFYARPKTVIPFENSEEFLYRTLNLASMTYDGVHSVISDFASDRLLLNKNTVVLS